MKGTFLPAHRIEALSDGIFAIAMTLLILEFHTPHLPVPDVSRALAQYLFELWPTFVCYVMSFLILGVFWIGHHNQYHFIKRSNRLFLWINIGFLMSIAFIPFSTALLGHYWKEPLAINLYAINMILGGLSLYGHWRYAINHELVDSVDPAAARLAGNRILRGTAAYLVVMLFSLIQAEWSLFICAIIPLLYIIPGKIDRYWAAPN